MIQAGIIGATGYTGAELIRLLRGHPEAEAAVLASRSGAGQSYGAVCPDRAHWMDAVLRDPGDPGVYREVDVLFVALPHGHAAEPVRAARAAGTPVIDLGADFRFGDKAVYEEWYGIAAPPADLLEQARYCLPEMGREGIAGAMVLANPGCYPTSVILGLLPLLEEGLIDPDTLVIDAKSGVSGAGRNPSLATHYCQVDDSLQAYNLGVHRHTPEIETQLGRIAGGPVRVTFNPHLVPMTRGILSTMSATLRRDTPEETIRELYGARYAGEPFVHLMPPGVYPATKWVSGSNHCLVGIKTDPRTGRVLVVSVIDNLVKGASGQAIQNMNIRLGLEETLGLEQPALFP